MQNYSLLILMFGAVAVMMVFGSRNKKKAALKAEQLRESILPGSTVMTTSGLHATVISIADDTIELEIAPGIYTTWVRAAVREVVVEAAGDTEYEDTEYAADEYADGEYAETEYPETEYADADHHERSGQDVEPIHDDHPSLKKRSNDVN